jgi:hypothetical protein
MAFEDDLTAHKPRESVPNHQLIFEWGQSNLAEAVLEISLAQGQSSRQLLFYYLWNGGAGSSQTFYLRKKE